MIISLLQKGDPWLIGLGKSRKFMGTHQTERRKEMGKGSRFACVQIHHVLDNQKDLDHQSSICTYRQACISKLRSKYIITRMS